MQKIWIIALREFVETVKTRAFIIGAVCMPLVMIGVVYAAERFADTASRDDLPPRRILLVDGTGQLEAGVRERIEAYNREVPNRIFELEVQPTEAPDLDAIGRRLENRELYAYVKVPSGAIDGTGPVRLARRDSQRQSRRLIQDFVTEALIDLRFARHDPPLDRSEIEALQARPAFEEADLRTGRTTEGDSLARLFTPFIFMFLLYMGTMQISVGLLTSVIEEKSSRIVEVLLACVSPVQLMAGKILGMVAVGALLMALWGLAGYGVARSQQFEHLVSGARLMYMGLYFVPSFLLFAAILAAIGSACNTLKEAQSLSSPLTLAVLVPMILWWLITEHPQSMLSVGLSFIPPITPFVMILRICGDPNTPIWQIAATLALLWITALAAIWAAGKVFRVGVLMYGKAPSLRELWRWVRLA